MAEDINIDFVSEVVVADGLEEICPVIIEVEVINVRVFAEQAAVIGWDIAVDDFLCRCFGTGQGSFAIWDW